MIVIKGISWIFQGEYGCVKNGIRYDYSNIKSLSSKLKNENIVHYPIKDFGRLDTISKLTCCSIALAMFDAGLPYNEHDNQDIGIVGTNSNGCLQSNFDYFKDYVENGRKLARGNLFIYTLPTSPLAEAAIHFGCQGPLLYITSAGKIISSLLKCAEQLMLDQNINKMLAIAADEEKSICFVLIREKNGLSEKICGLQDIVDITEKGASLEENIKDIIKDNINKKL